MSHTVCKSGLDQLIDYLEGQLPVPAAAALELHVAGCQLCQAFLASYHATPQIIRDATGATPPAGPASLLAWLRTQR